MLWSNYNGELKAISTIIREDEYKQDCRLTVGCLRKWTVIDAETNYYATISQLF